MSKISIPPELERRTEDYALITGRAQYVDDLRPPTGRPPALHLAVVRSPYAHATIKRINLDAARALPGVAAAFAGAELVSGMPTFDSFPVAGLKNPERRPLLARGCARPGRGSFRASARRGRSRSSSSPGCPAAL